MSNGNTEATATLVVGSDINIIGSDKLQTIELNGPVQAGFLPRQDPPYLTVTVIAISGTATSLFKVSRNVKMTWGSDELHIRSPIHIEEYGTLTLPETVYIENGGILDICGTLTSDTGSLTARDGGKVRMSEPATTLNLQGFFIDYQGKLESSHYCTASAAKVLIQATYYNKSSDATVDTSKFTIEAAFTGELSPIGEELENITCDKGNELVLQRNQHCELKPGKHVYDSIVIYPGGMLKVVGDQSGAKTTTVSADKVNIMYEGKITGVGSGFKSNGPGEATTTSQGASHGGNGHSNSKALYGNVKTPMQYGSNGKGATASTKRGGGQLKLEVAGTITVDGEIDMSAQETGSGGSIYIVSQTFSGFGTIRADGGNGGGGGGRISVEAEDIYDFTGTFSVVGGDDDSGKPTCAGTTLFIL